MINKNTFKRHPISIIFQFEVLYRSITFKRSSIIDLFDKKLLLSSMTLIQTLFTVFFVFEYRMKLNLSFMMKMDYIYNS